MRETHTLAVCENGDIQRYNRDAVTKTKRTEKGIRIKLDRPTVERVEHFPAYCSDCGKKVLVTCPECSHPIEAANQKIAGDETDRPNFCTGCGTNFPWTSTIESEVSRDDTFLDIDESEVDGQFYPGLIYETNLSYRVQADHATLILNRKLIESLLTDILKAEFGYENVGIFFDTENSQFHGLKELIKRLKENEAELSKHSGSLDEDLYRQIRELKHDGDAAAHVVEDTIREEELQEKSEIATRVVKILLSMRESAWTMTD